MTSTNEIMFIRNLTPNFIRNCHKMSSAQPTTLRVLSHVNILSRLTSPII